MTQGKVDLISYFWSQVTLFISNRVRDGVKPSRLNETVPMQNRAQGCSRDAVLIHTLEQSHPVKIPGPGTSFTPGVVFHRTWLQQKNLDPSRLFALQALGEAMQPTILHGDMLVVETYPFECGSPFAASITQGGVYVIKLRTRLLIRRLQLDLQGGLYIKSDNAVYRDIYVTSTTMADISIIGRVVWVSRTFL